MTEERSSLADRAREFRQTFDRSFAEPVRDDAVAIEDLLTFRLPSGSHALRLAEAGGVFAGRAVTKLPGSDAELLGISGFRGTLVPVYDLHALLGAPSVEQPRWLVTAKAAPLAFAFETFEGHLRVPADSIVARPADHAARPYVRRFVAVQQTVHPLVHLQALVDAIVGRTTGKTQTGSKNQ
jgi:purine-binding chemotaxis protein CheW